MPVIAQGDAVEAFVPNPLPPTPAINLDGPLQPLLERALVALGGLDALSTLLPDPDLFLYSYIRKEALLSSQIEGTQSSLSELLLSELEEIPGAPFDDVQEVSNYVRALNVGISLLRNELPLSARLIRNLHAELLERGRGSDQNPGEFRRSQNWVGGKRAKNATYVPPPHTEVPDCITDLEKFIHDDRVGMSNLIKAAVAHVQFETIHPFLDGNGRVGRLLIVLMLINSGLLKEPTLYLSLYFKSHRAEYYRLLDVVRKDGDWEAWLSFFLEGVEATAKGAVDTVRRLRALVEHDQQRVQSHGKKTGSTLRLLSALSRRPLVTVRLAVEMTGLSQPTANVGLELLGTLGIVREITSRKRDRVFAYDQYLEILSEGTEPL